MKSIIDAVKPVSRPVRVLQYGEGNFLRAFVDWMIDIINEKAGFDGSVVIAQPLKEGLGELLNAQKGLYTTVLRGVQEGKTVSETRTITSVQKCVNPYTAFDEYFSLAECDTLRFVFSNTTEAGISYSAADKLEDKPQKSFPGKVTAFLYRRFTHYKGRKDRGLVFIPCELIEKNGVKLREIVVQYAREWNLGEPFLEWLDCCDFCSSLVDRVVSGYPKEEAANLESSLGYGDKLLDAAEIFHLWVIEGKDHKAELPFHKAGLNVIWCDDMSFYRTRKVRILNGAHTSTVLAAHLCGLETVEECTKDPDISALLKKNIFDEIIPSMDGDVAALKTYAADVLERFANPNIRHLLLSISLNSISKFKTRVLPSIKGYAAKKGAVPRALGFSFAAMIAFYNIPGSAKAGYSVKDDDDIIAKFTAWYKDADLGDAGTAEKIARSVLAEKSWWGGENLNDIAGLTTAVAAGLRSIWTKGARAAVAEVLKN